MKLKKIDHQLSVCKVADISDIKLTAEIYFIGKTDEELSLVCKTEDKPSHTIECSDGWRGFRIQGVLEFSLVGILSKLSGILAEHIIGIFAVSTFNTDYILVKENHYSRAMEVLASEGYVIVYILICGSRDSSRNNLHVSARLFFLVRRPTPFQYDRFPAVVRLA